MPTSPPRDNSSLKFTFDEHRWILQISKSIDEELEEEIQAPVSIFSIPKTLMLSDPDSYLPQEVAIGPYHYFTSELYGMERYKVAAAKRLLKEIQALKFQDVVERLKRYDCRIRAHYHSYLRMSDETLAWIMAVDASFLLEFLRIYGDQEGMVRTTNSLQMSSLLDSRSSSLHNAVLRDMVKLENQIPLFILRKLLEFQCSSPEVPDNLLLSMLTGLCKQLCPFKTMEILPKISMTKTAHLLDFLYSIIVPKSDGLLFECKVTVFQEERGIKEDEGKPFEDASNVRELLQENWKIIEKLDKGPARKIKRILFSKPIQVIVKLPWVVISNFPGIRSLKQPVEKFFSEEDKEDKEGNENSKAGHKDERAPLVEETVIPSVTKLSKAGVRFAPTNAGIMSIAFDVKTVKFYLPTVFLDINTKVVLRNLVAYEACNVSGPLIFTRYIELMNGLLDNEEDAKFLRKNGILVNYLMRDNEVPDLWNGMSKAIKLTKVDFLDQAIADVNKYYNGRCTVKAKKFMKSYVFGSWKFLTLLAALWILLMMALQSFCTVYSCPHYLDELKNVD